VVSESSCQGPQGPRPVLCFPILRQRHQLCGRNFCLLPLNELSTFPLDTNRPPCPCLLYRRGRYFSITFPPEGNSPLFPPPSHTLVSILSPPSPVFFSRNFLFALGSRPRPDHPSSNRNVLALALVNPRLPFLFRPSLSPFVGNFPSTVIGSLLRALKGSQRTSLHDDPF